VTSRFILAIDQGTTGSRAFIIDSTGTPLASSYEEFPQYFPRPGWVEHDPEEIWKSVVSVVHGAITKAAIPPRQIEAIGITNQRETVVLWDRNSGRPLARAIVWQDRRTADMCENLKKKKLESLFQKKTGLVLDPYFSGTKIHWYLKNIKGLASKAKNGEICIGTIDSWLIWKLTGGHRHVTDSTNASRTLMYNIHTREFDAELLKILGIPKGILPQVLPSAAKFGFTAGNLRILPKGIPITGVAGDQQAALFGQNCVQVGQLKNTYGTGSFVMMNTGQKAMRSKFGLLTTIACDAEGQPCYALEGAIFITGAAIQWLRDGLKIIENASETEAMAQSVPDNGGVYFVPALVGLGAPHWRSDVRGLITGVTRGTTRAHLVRAALESMAYQTRDVVVAMEKDARTKIKELDVDGGACKNDWLMQFQANILDAKIARPKIVETTVWGAAALAGIGAKLWTPKHVQKIAQHEKEFLPNMNPKERKDLLAGWDRAISKAKTTAG